MKAMTSRLLALGTALNCSSGSLEIVDSLGSSGRLAELGSHHVVPGLAPQTAQLRIAQREGRDLRHLVVTHPVEDESDGVEHD